MRYFILLIFLTTASTLQGQNLKPQSIYVSYFGETATHPGLKVGVNYQLKGWNKAKKNSGKEKVIQKSFDLNPGIGFYYHKDYQTGLFVLPELSYSRKNAKGNFLTYAIGAGYMRTFIPNVYEVNANEEIKKISAGYNYFLTNYSIAFGKDLSVTKLVPVNVFVKPQLLYAMPNYAKGVWYFALEFGVGYKLTKDGK